MNGRKVKKITQALSYTEEGCLMYGTKPLSILSRGSYRKVYDLPGTGCILKVTWDDSEEQCDSEWEGYLALRKTDMRKYLVKQTKPFAIENHEGDMITMSIHRKVKGDTVFTNVMSSDSESPNIEKKYNELAYELRQKGVDDVHNENVMVKTDKPTRRRKYPQFKLVDIGRYYGPNYESDSDLYSPSFYSDYTS